MKLDQAPREGSSARFAQTAALIGVLATAYVVLGRLAFSMSVQHGSITSVVFASEGVALGFVISFGARVVPGVLIGQTILSIWSGPSILGGFTIGLFNSAEALLGLYLFRRLRISPRLNRPRDAGLFIGMIFFVLQPLSATGGVAILYALGAISRSLPPELAAWWIRGIQAPLPSPDLIPAAWFAWWTGNSMGQLLVAPLLVIWLSRRPFRLDLRAGSIICALGIAAVAVLTLSNIHVHPLVLLALVYPVLVWIAIEHGARGVVVGNALIAPAVIWAGAKGQGLLAGHSIQDRVAFVSFFIGSACVLSLLLAGLFEERSQLLKELVHLAHTDDLTSLSNRRHFMKQAQQFMDDARTTAQPLSVLMVDIDYFKTINDDLGHAAGDDVIRAVAGYCGEHPGVTLAARFGGEEFVLLLTGSALPEATACAEDIRSGLADTQFGDDAPVAVTVSVGVASHRSGESLDNLIGRADAALYEAKRDGRNRVSVAG